MQHVPHLSLGTRQTGLASVNHHGHRLGRARLGVGHARRKPRALGRHGLHKAGLALLGLVLLNRRARQHRDHVSKKLQVAILQRLHRRRVTLKTPVTVQLDGGRVLGLKAVQATALKRLLVKLAHNGNLARNALCVALRDTHALDIGQVGTGEVVIGKGVLVKRKPQVKHATAQEELAARGRQLPLRQVAPGICPKVVLRQEDGLLRGGIDRGGATAAGKLDIQAAKDQLKVFVVGQLKHAGDRHGLHPGVLPHDHDVTAAGHCQRVVKRDGVAGILFVAHHHTNVALAHDVQHAGRVVPRAGVHHHDLDVPLALVLCALNRALQGLLAVMSSDKNRDRRGMRREVRHVMA